MSDPPLSVPDQLQPGYRQPLPPQLWPQPRSGTNAPPPPMPPSLQPQLPAAPTPQPAIPLPPNYNNTPAPLPGQVPGGARPMVMPRPPGSVPGGNQPITPQAPADAPPPVSGTELDPQLARDPSGRNNPGNIRTVGGPGGPGDFQTFPTMAAGLQAMQNQLLRYQDVHGLNTVAQIIGRYSPPNENPTAQLIMKAAARMGVGPYDRIDLHDPTTMMKLMNAILAQEQSGGGGGTGDPQRITHQPQQGYTPAEQRGFEDWGHPPPMMGSQIPGAMPQRQDFGGILGRFMPLLLGIASIALRLPLSTAITAYSAAERARQNGQEQDYERETTKYQRAAKEAAAQADLESRDYGDAFATYGHNNPQGLQQTLAQLALKYNDQQMYQLAIGGDLNGAHALQARRDQLNQNLVKVNKAQEDEQDRRATDAAVTAMDHKWHDDFVAQNGREPTPDETAIAHNEHIGEAGRAGTKDPKAEGTKEDAQPYEVVDKTSGEVTRQVRLGQGGGLFDLNGKPTQLGSNERLGGKVGGGGEEKPTQEKTALELAGAKARTDEWAKAQNPPVQPDSNAYKAHLAEEVQKVTEAKPAAEGPKPSDYKDYTWDDSQGKHHGPSSAALVPGQGLVDPQGKPIDAKPETIRTVSSATSSPAEGYPHDAGQGEYPDRPNRPPPGTDITEGEWAQALTYVNTGKAPTFARDRQAMARFREIVPVAMRAMNVTDEQMNRRWVDYAAYKTREQRIEAAFAGGQDGKTLLALNTIAHHINLYRQYAAAMRAHDQPAMNAIIDNLARQGGAPELMDFNVVSRVTGDELVRVLTGTGGGTITDREDIAHQLSAYSSPEQFEGVADALVNVIRGRFEPLELAYTRGDAAKKQYFEQNMMVPEAREMFQGPQRPIPGAGAPALTEEQYNSAPSGTRYRMPSDPPGTVRVKP